jgi:hypothetical protein
MTRRRADFTQRSFDQLLQAAGDRMDPDANKALREYQRIREAGGKPQIEYSLDFGWHIRDLLKE